MKKDQNDEENKSDLSEKYLRALADYQNLQKQTETWREEFVKFANTGLIKKLLEILDDLEKAQEHLQDGGLKIIIGKLQNILQEEGLEELELEGKEFDPSLAEVVSTEVGEKENTIVKVLQKGYRLKNKVIRPGKVIVWAKS